MPLIYRCDPANISQLISLAISPDDSSNEMINAIKQHNQQLIHTTTINISRKQPPCIYVQEQEIACATHQHTDIAAQPCTSHVLIGSSDATTCIIAGVYDPLSHTTVVAHINRSDQSRSFIDCIHQHIHNTSAILQLHVVGSFHVDYGDKQQTIEQATDTLQSILNICMKSHLTFQLITYLVCHLNQYVPCNQSIKQPISRQLYIDTCTGAPHINVMIDSNARGPELTLRRCYFSSNQSHTLHDIYDTNNDNVCIRPFNYQSPYSPNIINQLLSLSNQLYCHYCSSSPLNETDQFVDDSRHSLLYQLQYPNSTHIFNKQKPILYQRVGRSNQWSKIQ